MKSKVKHEDTQRARVRSGGDERGEPLVQVPGPVRQLIRTLEDAGYETWTVGGAVRDALQGIRARAEDWDLATLATPRQVQRLFERRTVPLGVEYGTTGVFGSDKVLYEVTTFRHDVITYGRKAKVAFAKTLDEDLARRDFTVNAMAWHPRRRELRDRHGGRDDLQDRILRAVGSPRKRFREDYLRVLRGLRFAGALNMKIDPDTWDGMVEAVPGLTRLSMERVREELEKVLAGPHPSRSLALYQRSGALKEILPELRNGASAEALATVDALERGDWLLRMAALLLFGMDPGDATPDRVAGLLARLRFSNADAERTGAVVRGGLAPPEGIADDPVVRRRWVSRMVRPGHSSVEDILRIWKAVAEAAPTCTNPGAVDRVATGIRRDDAAGIPTKVGDLPIAGRDLVAQGWLPGPGIGAALRSLMEAVWEDPTLNDRTTLLEMVAAMNLERPPR
ncbi:MAG: CCA tRNA nucleotidyltransferase [Gemmatimonadetes bacterium]|nr:CCA tRNA nucleotidyltransferase [Gemmatimonadota bacterium]MYH53078.1 CCA tRNA nucleotidyltransferase [Gemmatimonadota bacterium]MYK66419.1 CCA tRNA nucleotidyltransferase [Gemmatimonadota bacterium]